MAAVLTEITGTTFGLAKSGTQGGLDGESVLNSGAVSFEGKLYEDRVPKNEVLSKIAEIAANDNGQTDLWIMGSTGIVATQDVRVVKTLGEKHSIATLILDWSTTGLATFAALLAMASEAATSFLADRTSVSEDNIAIKLAAVREHPQFADRSRELAAAIEQPNLGPAYAQSQNEAWLHAAFASTGRARTVFGQPLAPADVEVIGVLDRSALRDNLSKLMYGKPAGGIAAILGADGNGKSWLFAQAWMHQSPKPLTVILVPDDVQNSFMPDAVEDLLISTLITQTGNRSTEISKARWRKQFMRWARLELPECPRLVVFLDGINQRETVNWKRFIDSANDVLTRIGGKLVFSCRTPFFQSNLKGRLVDDVQPLQVPEWTNPELESLLAERGTSIDKLKPSVVDFLRNPRIFAVAADLFKNRQIEQFAELSVSRLLFEHIRISASSVASSMAVPDFVRGIRQHADEIIKRLARSETNDLKIFERMSGNWQSSPGSPLYEQFSVVSAGQFFEPLSEDPTLYALREDSLPLALGLSLLSTVQRAQRNKLNIDAELSKILDPISALDNTADVLISALVAAVVGDGTSDAVVAALVSAFIALQNLDASRFQEFRALARKAPTAFLAALEEAVLAEGVSSNLSWLTLALLESRHETESSRAIATYVHRWLSMYSPAPERTVLRSHGTGNDEHAKELEKRKDFIDGRIAAFSGAEQRLLEALVLEERGDYSKLNAIAFQFLAGIALKDFAIPLRNWCFAASLNGGFRNGHENFDHLVQFNLVDWVETRSELLRVAHVLREEGTSETGQRALIYLLCATGDSSDAKQAEELSGRTEGDAPGAWRLIEQWCAADPCDPSSEKPANITATAEKFAALDVSEVKGNMGQSQQDHFVDGALVGLARFEPQAAVEMLRRFSANVLTRDNPHFRLAAFFLANHTASLDHASAVGFAARASRIASDTLSLDDKHRELFVASQYGLLIAFPHMTGDEQLRTLMAYPRVDNILLTVCDLMQACDALNYEQALEKAYSDGDTVNQFRLMTFGEHTETSISDRAKAIVGELTTSTDNLVRLTALGLVRRLEDPNLLTLVVKSGWDAHKLDRVLEKFEVWYGSEVLVLAARQGILSVTECLSRIDLNAYPSFVQKVGREAAIAIIGSIDAAISSAANQELSESLPEIEEHVGAGCRPVLFDVHEKPNSQESAIDSLKRLGESGDAWYERHLRNRESVEKFEKELTRTGAELLVQSLSPDLIRELYRQDPPTFRVWHDRFMSFDTGTLGKIHNVALLVAQVIACENPVGAVALFEKLRSSSPLVRVTFGNARVTLDAVAVWNAPDGNVMRELWFQRLDQAKTDHDISIEVLAATNAGKQDCLREYVIDRSSRAEPAHVARAVMVAGMSDGSEWASETIESVSEARGFLAGAYEAAKYAMDRHLWSRHWQRKIDEANTEVHLWRHAVILAKIVDGRWQGGEVRSANEGRLATRYGATFDDLFHRRISKWKSKRKKTLFGQQTPDPMFLK